MAAGGAANPNNAQEQILSPSGPAGTKKSRDEIAQAYKSEPWWYDVRGFFILTFAYNSTLPAQLRLFGPNMGARHLEVACGTGTLLELILRWRRWKQLPECSIVGVDYAESMLAGARHRFAGQAGLSFEHADVAEMPFGDNSFDTANVANAVHCFPDVNGALRGVLRVLKPGGTMAANVLIYPRGQGPLARIAGRINRWGMRKGILVTPYETSDVRQRILDAGFEITSEAVAGNCYNVMAVKPKP
ncbi:MAG: class I SAM-dependent methyltransferase [Rubrivivax sp.]|nr:class I SAM-dependent methyltransferase [Rubrivivax sp.]